MYYKAPDNKVHFLESTASEHRLPPGSVPITDEEAAQLCAPSTADVRASMWVAIKAERDRRIQDGGYKVGSKWFHSDTFSRTQQMGLVMMGANIPANTPWKTMDGSEITMTAALAGQIFTAAAQSDIAIFAVAKAHRTAMEALADPATFDVSQGWPLVFGE